MIRLPFLPTLLVAFAVACMVGLGLWQLQRAELKERLLADYRAARTLPPIDLDAMLLSETARADEEPPLSYRRVRITCHVAAGTSPAVRIGRRRETGLPGVSYFVPCFRDVKDGWRARLQVNAGWSQRPDVTFSSALLDGRAIEGVIGAVERDFPITLTADRPVPPLEPSAAPDIEDIPNNHLSYAVQWFIFAAAALVIYFIALRRRGRQKLPPEP